MIHLFKSAAAKLWVGTVVLVILFGIFIGSVRLLLPLASGYKAELETLLAEELQVSVRIGASAARLQGLTPVLVLKDVKLQDPDDPSERLELAEVQLDFDLVRSLLTGSIRIEQATIARARLELKRLSDGSLQLTGTRGVREEGKTGMASRWFFLSVDGLRLIDSEVSWEDRMRGGGPVQFREVQILFRNDGDRHQFDARARVPGSGKGWVRIAADFHGNVQQPDDVHGEIYAKGSHLALGPLFAGYTAQDYRIESGQLDMELWGNWDRGGMACLTGRAALHGLRLAHPLQDGARRMLGIARVQGRMQWRRRADGWQLGVRDLQFDRADHAWSNSELSLRYRAGEGRKYGLLGGFSFLRSADLVAASRLVLAADSGVLQGLQAIDPQAEVRGLQFIVEQADAGVAWSARGQVSGLRTRAWKGLPGITGLNARFWADHRHGTLDVESTDVTVHFPGLFREPLRADGLDGRLRWEWRPGGTLVADTPLLVAVNGDVRTRTRMQLLLPGDGSSPFLDLQTDFRDGRVDAIPGYLPVGIMSKSLVDWLDGAFVSGRITSGSALVRGPLEAFPFKRDAGRFETLFSADELIIDYLEDWPRLEGVAAEVRFLDGGLSLRLQEGYLLETRIERGAGHIRDLERTSPLVIEASLKGPLADGLRILSVPPLAEEFHPFTENIRVSGQARTTLAVSLPIDDGSPLRVKGSLRLDDVSLRTEDPVIWLSQLRGEIGFSQEGVQASGVSARAFGIPLTLDLDTLSSASGQTGVTRISVRGGVPLHELERRYPGKGFQFLAGSAPFRLQLDVPHNQPANERLTADLDLTGVAVHLPEPVGKPAGTKRTLRILSELSDRPVSRFDITYGDDIAAALVFAEGGAVERGAIRFGGGRVEPRQGRGLWLEGSLRTFDMDGWLAWGARNLAGGAAGEREPDLFRGVDLNIGQLLLGGYRFPHVELHLQRRDNAWTGRVGSDLLAGSVYLPHDFDAGPLVAKLDYLSLSGIEAGGDAAPQGADGAAQVPKGAPLDPREFPGLDLLIRKVRMNEENIGELKLLAERTPAGLQMSRLSIKGSNLDLTGSGNWIVRGDEQRTELTLAADIKELGTLLRRLGFASLIEQGASKLDASLSWPGDPTTFSVDTLEGTLDLDVGAGRLLEVSPGVGRVFGLLNLGAVRRRLSLDFSDLFRKGFSFDKIKASFRLQDGNAVTKKASIEGPAAQIEFSGRTGLVARDYDQTMTVTPRVSGSIPLAGALAGGPVVGAALLAAQQLLGKQVDKITRYQYTLTGSWDDPVFEPLHGEKEGVLSRIFGGGQQKAGGTQGREKHPTGIEFLDQ